MGYQAILEPDGSLVLPPEVQHELGIPLGSTVDLQVDKEGVRIAVHERRPRLTGGELTSRIQAIQAVFAGANYSLEDDLIKMRQEEAERSMRKYGC